MSDGRTFSSPGEAVSVEPDGGSVSRVQYSSPTSHEASVLGYEKENKKPL